MGSYTLHESILSDNLDIKYSSGECRYFSGYCPLTF